MTSPSNPAGRPKAPSQEALLDLGRAALVALLLWPGSAVGAEDPALRRLRDTAALLRQQQIDQLEREQRLERLRFEQQLAAIEQRARQNRDAELARGGGRTRETRREVADLRLREQEGEIGRERLLEGLRRREAAARSAEREPPSREEESARLRRDQQIGRLGREFRAQVHRYERLDALEKRTD